MADEDLSPFEIDPRALDHECIVQPRLARAAGVREADARHLHAQAKARLEVVQARLSLAVRNNPEGYDLRPKPTVDEVAFAVTITKEYQEALAALNEAKYALDVASAETTAFVDRRKMIENLVELTCIDYNSEREPGPRSEAGRAQVARARIKRGVGDGVERKDRD